VQKWLQSGGCEFDGVNFSNSLQLMLRLVRAGHAISVLPMPVLREFLGTGELRLLPARPAIPQVSYYASYQQSASGKGTPSIVEIAKSVLQAERFFDRVPEPVAA
jgi:DNA-binding transcriptional LysR family regulator